MKITYFGNDSGDQNQTTQKSKEILKYSGCYSKRQLRYLGKTQEGVGRGAFRLGRGELCCVRRTDRQTIRPTDNTQRLIPDPKNLISPLAFYSASPPPSPSSHPFIPHSHPPHFLPSPPSSQALDCFCKHTHTHTHARTHTLKTPHRDPQDYISGPKHSPKSILVLTKSDERGWLMRRIWLPTLQRGRSETEDLATLPRHLRYPSDDITTARDLQAATVIKCD